MQMFGVEAVCVAYATTVASGELEEAKAQLWREDAEGYRILMREISKEEKERIVGTLTDKGERVLFGLEAPEELKGTAMRPVQRR